MVFESPRWLFALLVVPAVWLLEHWARRADASRLHGLVARALWLRVVRQPEAELWRFVRLGLLCGGAVGLVLALARPQWGIVRERIEREGVDVVLALDTSASMGTEDVAPSRFFLARQALLSLVAGLGGDRVGLLAFEGDAYPLAPLTLDADAVGLFLESVEPGIVPSPGTSLGAGLARGLAMFVDADRRNKVLVLVSDGEDLEGEVEQAVKEASKRGVVVHTVGVGTEAGQPVPQTDAEGRRTGYKRDSSGSAVVSRFDAGALQAIARGTGGQFYRITPSDSSLAALATAIEAMDRRSLASEYSYRRKERFQIPLAAALGCFAAALLLPLPLRRRGAALATAVLCLALGAWPAVAQGPKDASPTEADGTGEEPAEPLPPIQRQTHKAPASGPPAPVAASPAEAPKPGLVSEILLRPKRKAAAGRSAWDKGDHPAALRAFEDAASARPKDPAARFNVADGLYKNGRYDEAAAMFRDLGADASSPLAAASRYNLGNSLYQRKDYSGAIAAYRDALRLRSADVDTRRNLELALRALEEQKQQQKRDQDKQSQDQKQDKQKQDEKDQPRPKEQNDKGGAQGERPKAQEEREKERFEREAGMPKERAEQLLAALQRNEAAEQKKQLAAKRAERKGGKDW